MNAPAMGGAGVKAATIPPATLKNPRTAMRIRFDFDSPPPEHLALDAYGATLVVKYGPGFRYNAVAPTAEEATEIDRLNEELCAAHERAFLEYHRERVRGWCAAMRGE